MPQKVQFKLKVEPQFAFNHDSFGGCAAVGVVGVVVLVLLFFQLSLQVLVLKLAKSSVFSFDSQH